MVKDVKAFHALELESGETCIISTDKRQMARWYALDKWQCSDENVRKHRNGGTKYGCRRFTFR